jgi:uncharacterized membrane protein
MAFMNTFFANLLSRLALTGSKLIACALIGLTAFSCKNSQEPTPSTSGPYFAKVKTIISSNCLSCHLSTGSWSGRPTAFDTDAQIVAAAQAIKASVADPVTITNKRMPQGATLSQADVDTIVAWYKAGGLATN